MSETPRRDYEVILKGTNYPGRIKVLGAKATEMAEVLLPWVQSHEDIPYLMIRDGSLMWLADFVSGQPAGSGQQLREILCPRFPQAGTPYRDSAGSPTDLSWITMGLVSGDVTHTLSEIELTLKRWQATSGGAETSVTECLVCHGYTPRQDRSFRQGFRLRSEGGCDIGRDALILLASVLSDLLKQEVFCLESGSFIWVFQAAAKP
jgi:hypothetical protein